jgi:hypothetical protein
MRGMKWITEMEMVLILMETLEGGWRSLSEVISVAFLPSNLLWWQPTDSLFQCF